MNQRVIYLQGQWEDPDVTHITFPTGEKHIRIRNLTNRDHAVLVYNDPSGDVMKLGMAVDICRRSFVNGITLVMPFVPYARQDRVATEGDPVSIEVFADFINSLRLDRVYITDPHSDVTPALLDNVTVIHQHEVGQNAVFYLEESPLVRHPIALVAPDLGAAKKVKALQLYLANLTKVTYPIIQCDKARDPITGQITGFKILDGDPTNHHCLMVDDICDGGGTFLGLADVLNENYAAGQSLYITHGIFSKGTEALSNTFQYIFASDSFPQQPNVTTIPLKVPA